MATGIYELLAKRIRAERDRRGLTLEQLAAAADISTGFLSYIEQNRKKASLTTVQRLADALRLSISELFEGIAPKPKKHHEGLDQIVSIFRNASPRKRKTILQVIKTLGKVA